MSRIKMKKIFRAAQIFLESSEISVIVSFEGRGYVSVRVPKLRGFRHFWANYFSLSHFWENVKDF